MHQMCFSLIAHLFSILKATRVPSIPGLLEMSLTDEHSRLWFVEHVIGSHYHMREKLQFQRKCEAAPSVLDRFLHLLGVQDFLWFPLSDYEG